MTTPQRFRGSLVASPWTKGVFWDRVDVTREQIRLHPWLRKRVILDRPQVKVVEFETVRYPCGGRPMCDSISLGAPRLQNCSTPVAPEGSDIASNRSDGPPATANEHVLDERYLVRRRDPGGCVNPPRVGVLT